jgi:hypothetical protein
MTLAEKYSEAKKYLEQVKKSEEAKKASDKVEAARLRFYHHKSRSSSSEESK